MLVIQDLAVMYETEWYFSLGDCTAIDVCSIYSGDQFLRYSTSMLAYGYYGDMLKDSENNRWMGPKRYQVAGRATSVWG